MSLLRPKGHPESFSSGPKAKRGLDLKEMWGTSVGLGGCLSLAHIDMPWGE